VLASTPASGTNGAPATLRVSAGATVVWESPTQTGAILSPILCAEAGGYNATVTFTAQLIHTASQPRKDSDLQTRAAVSADVPKMSFSLESSGPANGTPSRDKHVCATFVGDGGGFAVKLTVSALGQQNSDQGPNALSVSLCVDGGTAASVTFVAEITDQSTLNRPTPSQKTVSVPVATDPPEMSLVLTSSGPTASGASTNKEVCATFTGNGNGYAATLTVSTSLGAISGAGTGALSRTLCVTPSGASQTVVFTATMTDNSEIGRTGTVTLTQSVTSPPDPPSCTFTIVNSLRADVTVWNPPPNYQITWKYTDGTGSSSTDGPACVYEDWPGATQADCKVFNGNHVEQVDFGSSRNLTDSRNTVQFWIGTYAGDTSVATCTKV